MLRAARRICSNLNKQASISDFRNVNGGVNWMESGTAFNWSEPVVSPVWCESMGGCALRCKEHRRSAIFVQIACKSGTALSCGVTPR